MEVSRPSLLHDAHHGTTYSHSLRESHAAFMDAGAKSFYYDDDEQDDQDEVRDLRMSQFPRPSRLGNANEMRMSSIAKLPTMPLRGPAFHGWLWKKGASFKTWKKRFFLLNGSTLTYYTQSCVVSTELGVKCLEMPAKGGLRLASADFTDMTQFGIKVTSSSGRVLYVQAGDSRARIKWLGVLQEAAKKRHSDSGFRGTTVSDVASFKSLMSSKDSVDERSEESLSLQSSSMSSTLSSEEDAAMVETDMKGWLFVRRRGSAFVTLFKKRYVTLADGHLTITRTQRDRRPHEKTHEVISATVWSVRENGLRMQLGNHKELVVYTETSDERKRWLQALHNNL